MTRVLLKEAGLVPVAVIAIVLAVIGAIAGGQLVSLPLLPRGVPVTWLIACAGILNACYLLRSRWSATVAALPRSLSHRVLLVTSAGGFLVLSYNTSLPAGVPMHELLLVVALLAVGIISVMTLGDLYWVPIAGTGLLVESLNNLLGGELAMWINIHTTPVLVVTAVVLVAAIALYLVRGPRSMAADIAE